jgi:hypothetical protein
MQGRGLSPVYTFFPTPTLLDKIQFTVKFGQKDNGVNSTSMAVLFEQ